MTSGTNNLTYPQLRRFRRYARLMWALSLLFACRVSGQALQHWAAQPFLPPFESFQGSNLPYWLLLSAQLVILTSMVLLSWRIQAGTLRPDRRVGNVLAWLGGVYMGGSIWRLVVGLAIPEASAWFSAWIPAVFHVLLASFVLTLAVYNLLEPRVD